MSKLRTATKTKRVRKDLHGLDPKEKAEIIAEISGEVEKQVETKPEVLRPGMTNVSGHKIPYTRKHLDEIYGVCEFVPEETIPVTAHGVRYQLLTGVLMSAPTIVRDIYLRHREIMRKAASGLPDGGFETIVELGAGALPPQ